VVPMVSGIVLGALTCYILSQQGYRGWALFWTIVVYLVTIIFLGIFKESIDN